jgi:hypothetical protein
MSAQNTLRNAVQGSSMSKFLPSDMKKWNPFYSNHLFNPKDLQRAKLTWGDKLKVLFCPMKVMVGESGAYFYKVRGGKCYLFKYISHDGKTIKQPESDGLAL